MWPFKKKKETINVILSNPVFESKEELKRVMRRIAKSVVKEMAPDIIVESYTKNSIIRQVLKDG